MQEVETFNCEICHRPMGLGMAERSLDIHSRVLCALCVIALKPTEVDDELYYEDDLR